jgi:hypothetical protein
MKSFQLLASWVGLLGGVGGFLALFLQWRSIYLEAPRINLKCTFAFDPSTGKRFYSVEVINKGGKPITINNLGFEFSNKTHTTFGLYPASERVGQSFPSRLDSHASQTWLFGSESTLQAFRDLQVSTWFYPYVVLATGKTIKSGKFIVSDSIS